MISLFDIDYVLFLSRTETLSLKRTSNIFLWEFCFFKYSKFFTKKFANDIIKLNIPLNSHSNKTQVEWQLKNDVSNSFIYIHSFNCLHYQLFHAGLKIITTKFNYVTNNLRSTSFYFTKGVVVHYFRSNFRSKLRIDFFNSA